MLYETKAKHGSSSIPVACIVYRTIYHSAASLFTQKLMLIVRHHYIYLNEMSLTIENPSTFFICNRKSQREYCSDVQQNNKNKNTHNNDSALCAHTLMLYLICFFFFSFQVSFHSMRLCTVPLFRKDLKVNQSIKSENYIQLDTYQSRANKSWTNFRPRERTKFYTQLQHQLNCAFVHTRKA